MAAWTDYLDRNQPGFEAELLDFVAIASISALPDHDQDVKQAAIWVQDKLRQIGMKNCRLLETGGHPAVYADWCHAPNRPTILIYGHFDVQPADPLELWNHPPFEPVIENDCIVGRGASDDKGNMLIPIIAIQSLLATEDKLPVNVKCLFEGQEEIGSPQMAELIRNKRKLLACDMVLNADSVQWQPEQPALILGLRGLVGLQVDLCSAAGDVHSGTFGGTFLNPIHALAKLISSLHNPDGSVAVAGFYDHVQPIAEPEKGFLRQIPFDENRYRENLGLKDLWGEAEYGPLQRAWYRPCLDVNGIWGGFRKEGLKTIIPAQAHAKISCRLVPNQDPGQIRLMLRKHLEANCPHQVKMTITEFGTTALPYLVGHDHPGNLAAARVLTEIYNRPPLYIRMGFSVPVCGWFLKYLGAHTIGFGFGLDDECIHAPNEFFRLSSFRKGQKAWCLMLKEMADWQPGG